MGARRDVLLAEPQATVDDQCSCDWRTGFRWDGDLSGRAAMDAIAALLVPELFQDGLGCRPRFGGE